FGYDPIENDWGYTSCLAIDSEGMVYSSGSEDTSVHVYYPNGTLARVFDTPILGVVNDLAIGPEDKLYICGDREVLVMNRSGGLLLEIDPFLPGDSSFYILEGIALDESGQIFVSMDDPYTNTQPGLVRKYQANGTYMADIIVGDMAIDYWYDYYTKFYIGHDDLLYVINGTLIQVFDQNGVKLYEWGGYGNMPGEFVDPNDIILDGDGNVLVTDSYSSYIFGNALVQKFTDTGSWMFSFGYEDEYPQLNAARGIALDEDNSIYLGEGSSCLIQKFWHNTTWMGPVPPPVLDSDGDGLSDVSEETGWEITVTTEHGPGSAGETKWVSSDAFSTDTDKDGVPDHQEFDVGSDPRSVDTDKDNLKDAMELILGTDPCHWDSDRDGLSDGKEAKFGSDPLQPDSDEDGLNDLAEFGLGSDPLKNDTDQDGLGDLQEALAGSDLMDPDSDDDFMFDGTEFETGTGLNADDSDDDGISDGFESLYHTDPLAGDSDDDDLSDGFEVATRLNPLCNDTDGDGLNDSYELEVGLNPRSGDSDGDGIPDGLDDDQSLTLDQNVMLVVDADQFNDAFFDDLISRVNVTVVSAQELMDQHLEAKYIVLMGDPGNGAGTAGGLIAQLLAGSGDVLQNMIDSPLHRMAVRYGVWNATQTVVMFSMVYDTDAIRTVGVLKSMSMTVSEKGYLVQYHNPRACFRLDWIDSMHLTDTFIWAKLGSMDTFQVEVSKVNASEASAPLEQGTGLNPGWTALDKYVHVEVLFDDPNTTLEGALVRIYYTSEELDMNGDGDTDDVCDIDERSLRLWSFPSDDGRWERIGTELGPDMTGVNTTDQEIFGTRYSGYVWANVTDLSWFALAGRAHAIDVRVDVRSSNGQDKISINSGGMLRVIIYGNEEADGGWMDIASLYIGTAGVVVQKNDQFKSTCRDVDHDGWTDLVVYFSVPDLVHCGELMIDSELLEVNGSLNDAHGLMPIRGYGTVIIAPGQTR
ncbi:MAG: NHL repeat-containing protein, partial [Methanomassiliicoccales archaeon]|nr:NHL repeat-containing protein [Methanomassiliicoccales archaeon]